MREHLLADIVVADRLHELVGLLRREDPQAVVQDRDAAAVLVDEGFEQCEECDGALLRRLREAIAARHCLLVRLTRNIGGMLVLQISALWVFRSVCHILVATSPKIHN